MESAVGVTVTEGVGVGDSEGVTRGGSVRVGWSGVDDGSTDSVAFAGDGGTTGASSWLRRKPPSSINALRAVIARPSTNERMLPDSPVSESGR